jgi:alkylhydroperoxidase/carboxymuconolactone decarboxylase family protein YurZ
MSATVESLRREAEGLLADAFEGEGLDIRSEALIALAAAISVTNLDVEGFERSAAAALAAGAALAEIQEISVLVSALGVHSLMLSAPRLLSRAEPGDPALQPLSAEQQALWRRHVGDDPYWTAFETEFPGFLEALLRLSPDGFNAFHHYCGVPWRSGAVSAFVKELAAMACNATPTHRFAPGMRFHLRNALRLGGGRRAILEALDIAAAARGHAGVS